MTEKYPENKYNPYQLTQKSTNIKREKEMA